MYLSVSNSFSLASVEISETEHRQAIDTLTKKSTQLFNQWKLLKGASYKKKFPLISETAPFARDHAPNKLNILLKSAVLKLKKIDGSDEKQYIHWEKTIAKPIQLMLEDGDRLYHLTFDDSGKKEASIFSPYPGMFKELVKIKQSWLKNKKVTNNVNINQNGKRKAQTGSVNEPIQYTKLGKAIQKILENLNYPQVVIKLLKFEHFEDDFSLITDEINDADNKGNVYFSNSAMGKTYKKAYLGGYVMAVESYCPNIDEPSTSFMSFKSGNGVWVEKKSSTNRVLKWKFMNNHHSSGLEDGWLIAKVLGCGKKISRSIKTAAAAAKTLQVCFFGVCQ